MLEITSGSKVQKFGSLIKGGEEREGASRLTSQILSSDTMYDMENVGERAELLRKMTGYILGMFI